MEEEWENFPCGTIVQLEKHGAWHRGGIRHMTAVATVISNVTTATHRKMISQGVPKLCSIWDSSWILFYLWHLSVYWVTYIDSLKTPCHPWNGGSVNKLHLLGDYVEVSHNDLSDQEKHCDEGCCHLLSPDYETLSLQFTPMRSYNPHFADKGTETEIS